MRRTWLLAFVGVVLFSFNVYAYIDPGMGSMMAQVVLGSVIGGIFWFRNGIKNLFLKLKSLFHHKGE